MDDSHACIDTIKSAFTISISKSENPEIYSKILTLFNDDMIEQGEGSWLDIQAGDYNTFMAVPYWSWNNKKTEMLKILSAAQENSQIYYNTIRVILLFRLLDAFSIISAKQNLGVK